MEFLAGLTNYESSSGKLTAPTLGRVRALADALDRPQDYLDVVHVTGTNGKGSTAMMAASLLSATGRRVGLFTSPHLRAPTERIMIGGEAISDEILDRALTAVAAAAGRVRVWPTWFEAITLAALLIFRDAGVDAAVVEVGMLGSWDATNIVRSRVAVVTNVGLDHTEEAGGGLIAIAREKSGIVKHGATLVLGETDELLARPFLERPARQVLRRGRELRATNVRQLSDGLVVDLQTAQSLRRDVRVELLGRHQIANVLLAVAAAEAFLDSPMSDSVVRTTLSRVRLPGRGEVIAEHPRVVLDGAHNPDAARALRVMVDETGEGPRVLVVGVLAGRDHQEFLRAVGADSYDVVVCTQVDNPRSLPATDLAAALTPGRAEVVIEQDLLRACRIAVLAAGAGGQVVVTGSFYLLEPARQAILDAVAPATRPSSQDDKDLA
jgi:dihydrofolate synthase/folylpolyglutamate synthase